MLDTFLKILIIEKGIGLAIAAICIVGMVGYWFVIWVKTRKKKKKGK